ncbi:MAG TPA: hypothetical protein VG146_10125 [Verrucomicrobiae bacterium]|nr:hypothetical protein [Verrucomicrobiae bacterium]
MRFAGVLGRMSKAVQRTCFIAGLAFFAPSLCIASNVTLAWDATTDATVVGYNVYSGTASRVYTNLTPAGLATSLTLSNLAPGATYYFAATTFTATGLESDYSVEASYTVPNGASNLPPTLDPIADMSIPENAPMQIVNLTGITSGSSNEVQTLSVSAFSSNPGLVPNPTVNYTSPNTNGTISFTPAANSYGSVLMTVMVDDGATVSNTTIRSFNVTVIAPPAPPPPVTNAVIAPYTSFVFPINPPFTNGDKFSYSLGSGAPAGAKITTKKGVSRLVWTPTSAQASTTNLIQIVLSDTTTVSLSTNETVQVIVLDYLAVGAGSTVLKAGQSGVAPLWLSCSDGATNLMFAMDWDTNRFLNPSLFIAVPGISSSSVQTQPTNLVLSFQTVSGNSLIGSNVVAQLRFQSASNQSSAIISLPIRNLNALKPNGASYANYFSQAGQVVVVAGQPILQAVANASPRTLTVFGNPGVSYQLQFCTNSIGLANWNPLLTYAQTNLVQSLLPGGTNPLIFYRLLQQ